MQPLWKTVWRFLQKLKIEPAYDPAVDFGVYTPKQLKEVTEACNSQEVEATQYP